AWVRVQDGRSALHLLCEASTADAAEAVVMRVGHTAAEADQDEEATALLREFVRRLPAELRAGLKKKVRQRWAGGDRTLGALAVGPVGGAGTAKPPGGQHLPGEKALPHPPKPAGPEAPPDPRHHPAVRLPESKPGPPQRRWRPAVGLGRDLQAAQPGGALMNRHRQSTRWPPATTNAPPAARPRS